MDLIPIIAFVLGVVIVGIFFVIKNKKLIKADKIASQVISVLNKALTLHGDIIKEYDKENGTNYYPTLVEMMEKITAMEGDPEITPLEFALYVADMYESIEIILQNVSVLDKVIVVQDKA